MAAKDDYLIDTLIDMGVVTNDQIDPIRTEADSTGEGVVDTLLSKKIIRSADVAQAKAAQFGAEFIDLGSMKIADDVISAVPRHVAKRFSVIVAAFNNGVRLEVTECSARMRQIQLDAH